jgi:hypothetical protein
VSAAERGAGWAHLVHLVHLVHLLGMLAGVDSLGRVVAADYLADGRGGWGGARHRARLKEFASRKGSRKKPMSGERKKAGAHPPTPLASGKMWPTSSCLRQRSGTRSCRTPAHPGVRWWLLN